MEKKIQESPENPSENPRKNPLISIIVTFYNQEKFIPSCLELLIKQSYKSFEIICVNDASTDSSSKFLDYYQKLDSRIKVINNSENLGLVKSRKIGFENSKGDFITFVDGDDYLYPGAIKIFIDAYNKYQTPDFPIGAIGSEFEIIAGNSITYKRFRNYYLRVNSLNSTLKSDQVIPSNQIINKYINEEIWVSIWGKLIQRELVAKCQELVDDSVFYGEDQEFNFFLAKIMTEQKINFVKINKLLYYYRWGSSDRFNYSEHFSGYCQDHLKNWKLFLSQSKTKAELSLAKKLINNINNQLIGMINSTHFPEKAQMQETFIDYLGDFVVNNKDLFKPETIDKIKKIFS